MKSLILALTLLATPAWAGVPGIEKCASSCSYKNGSCSGSCGQFLQSCFKSKSGNSCYCGTHYKDEPSLVVDKKPARANPYLINAYLSAN